MAALTTASTVSTDTTVVSVVSYGSNSTTDYVGIFTPNSTQIEDSYSMLQAPAIAAWVLGSVALLVVIIALIVCCARRSQRTQAEDKLRTMNDGPGKEVVQLAGGPRQMNPYAIGPMVGRGPMGGMGSMGGMGPTTGMGPMARQPFGLDNPGAATLLNDNSPPPRISWVKNPSQEEPPSVARTQIIPREVAPVERVVLNSAATNVGGPSSGGLLSATDASHMLLGGGGAGPMQPPLNQPYYTPAATTTPGMMAPAFPPAAPAPVPNGGYESYTLPAQRPQQPPAGPSVSSDYLARQGFTLHPGGSAAAALPPTGYPGGYSTLPPNHTALRVAVGTERY